MFFYSLLKEKEANFLNEFNWHNILYEFVGTMFVYNGLENYLNENDTKFVDMILLSQGACAIWKSEKENKFVVSSVNFVGNIDEYGRGKDVNCITANGEQVTFNNWKDNKNVVVIFNNTLATPDINISKFADMLTEIDKSLNCNITNSRYMPLVVCNDSITEKKVKKVLENIDTGLPQTIVSPNILLDGEDVKVVNITDVTHADKLQYLTHLKDDLLREFFSYYGMNVNGTGKMAQQSVAEIKGSNNNALIIPVDMLKWRKMGVNELVTAFGWNVSVDLAECWKREEAEAVASVEAMEETEETQETEETEENNDEGGEE